MNKFKPGDIVRSDGRWLPDQLFEVVCYDIADGTVLIVYPTLLTPDYQTLASLLTVTEVDLSCDLAAYINSNGDKNYTWANEEELRLVDLRPKAVRDSLREDLASE